MVFQKIADKLSYYYRIAATGFSFFHFSAGGFFLGVAVFPLVIAWPSKKTKKKARIQKIIHYSFRYFFWQMKIMGILKVKVENAEKLKSGKSMLVIANHPTLIDIVFILSHMPRADCVVKLHAWNHPFFGRVARAAGYIKNDDPVEVIDRCVENLNKGDNVIIFPEGTRTSPDVVIDKFQKGAARIALKSGCNILPIKLDCQPRTLTKDKKWYEVAKKRFQLSMNVGELIDVAPVVKNAKNQFAAVKKLTNFFRDYYLKEVAV